MKMFESLILLVGVLFFSKGSLAHDGILKGEGIELKWMDHILIGKVDETIVFADDLSNEFGIRLFARVEGTTYETVFKRIDKILKSELVTTRNGVEKKTKFEIQEVNPTKGYIKGLLDSDVFEVNVTSDGMNEAHFINPTYTIKIGDKVHVVKMDDGEACMGCSMKILFAILSVKRNNDSW